MRYTPPGSRGRRPGYSIMLVVIYFVLLSASLGVSFRRISTVLRIETARLSSAASSDILLWRAAAEAMTELSKASPRTQPFTVTIPLYPDRTDLGTVSFVVTLSQDEPQTDANHWLVQVVPQP